MASQAGPFDGSIGGVILLMLWFYLSSLTLLVGDEINAVIQEGASGRGAAEPPPGHATQSDLTRKPINDPYGETRSPMRITVAT